MAPFFIAWLLSFIAAALVFYVLWWALKTVALPEPWNKVAITVLVVVTAYVVIGLLMGFVAPFPIFLKFIS